MATIQILSAALDLIAAHDEAAAEYLEWCTRNGYRTSHCFHGTRMVWADDRDAMCNACEAGAAHGYVNEYSSRGAVMVWALATAHENERERVADLEARLEESRTAHRALNARVATLWEMLGAYPTMGGLIEPELEALEAKRVAIVVEREALKAKIAA